MSKDMEMSCDESVIRKMGYEVKGSYSNSLLSLAVKRSGLIVGSPLAFGESNVHSRIKENGKLEVSDYKIVYEDKLIDYTDMAPE